MAGNENKEADKAHYEIDSDVQLHSYPTKESRALFQQHSAKLPNQQSDERPDVKTRQSCEHNELNSQHKGERTLPFLHLLAIVLGMVLTLILIVSIDAVIKRNNTKPTSIVKAEVLKGNLSLKITDPTSFIDKQYTLYSGNPIHIGGKYWLVFMKIHEEYEIFRSLMLYIEYNDKVKLMLSYSGEKGGLASAECFLHDVRKTVRDLYEEIC